MNLKTGRITKISLLNKENKIISYDLALIKEEAFFAELGFRYRFGFVGEDGSFFQSGSIHLTSSSGAGVHSEYIHKEIPSTVEIVTTDLDEIKKKLALLEEKEEFERQKSIKETKKKIQLKEAYDCVIFENEKIKVNFEIIVGSYVKEFNLNVFDKETRLIRKVTNIYTPTGRVSKQFIELVGRNNFESILEIYKSKKDDFLTELRDYKKKLDKEFEYTKI